MHYLTTKILEQNARSVKYVKTYRLRNAAGIIKEINKQIDRDFGLAGPLTLSTSSPDIHAVRWATARESYVVETHIKRVTKEIVAATISQINKCPYCEDVHSMSILSAGGSTTAEAIANGNWQLLKNNKLKEIIRWSLNTRNPKADIIKIPPFSYLEAPEIIGTALNFHSTNRLASIFLEASPMPAFLSNRLIKKNSADNCIKNYI